MQAFGTIHQGALTLGDAAKAAKAALGDCGLVAGWCDPAIDLALTSPPPTFGRTWPEDESLRVDEVDQTASACSSRRSDECSVLV